MVCIYILELANKKYYVGKTSEPEFRLDQHFNSDGSAWTKKYKPIKVLELIPGCDNFDEDKYTLKYMEKHGITNVRGGSFCQIKLSDENISTLNQMLNGSTDLCYICGQSGHFASACVLLNKPKKVQEDLNVRCNCPTSYFSPHRKSKCLLKQFTSLFEDEDDDVEKLVKINIPKSKPNLCEICGRSGHDASNCYAKTTVEGDKIIDAEVYECEYCGKEFETEKGASYHQRVYCKSKPKPKSNTCSRCGRSGHSASNCYAKTTVGGEDLDSDEEDEGFECEHCGKSFETEKGAQYHQRFYCKNK